MINNFGNKGIVQPSGGSRGKWADKMFGLLRSVPMVQLQMQLFDRQQEKITEEMGKRSIGAASAQAAGKIVTDKALKENAMQHADAVHKMVYEQYGTDHPDVKAGKVLATDFVRPGFVAYGLPEDMSNFRYSSRSAATAAEVKAKLQNQQTPINVGEGVGEGTGTGEGNNPGTPRSTGNTPNPAGRARRPRVKASDVEAAVSSGGMSEDEGVALSGAFAAKVARKKAGVNNPKPIKPKKMGGAK